MEFYTAQGRWLDISSTGNVGIASTTPWAKLSITNTGTGPSFLVEDTSSSDSSPFIIDASGNVGIGTTTTVGKFDVYSDAFDTGLKSYSPSSQLTNFFVNPYYNTSDSNRRIVDIGVLGNGVSALRFLGQNGPGGSVNSIMYLDGSGSVGIGTTTPGSLFSINSIANFTTATTSLYGTGGINISGGCFAVNGTCIAGGGGSGTVSSATQGQFAFYNANGTTVSGTSTLFASQAGNVGVGTSSPLAKFSVQGGGTGTGFLFELANSAYTSVARFFDNGMGYFLGNIGVGTTTPFAKFSVSETTSNPQFVISYDAIRFVTFKVDAAGDLIFDPQGDDVLVYDDNVWVCTGGACPAGAPTGTGNVVVENKAGIGTSTPAAKLSIETQDAVTNLMQVSSSTNQAILVINANGRIGVATSSPWAALSLGANKAIVTTEKTLTDAGTIAVSWTDGNQQKVTLGGNRTITFSNYIAGQGLRLILCQDGTGSRTASWDSNILWQGGSAPTLTTTANKCDLISFMATGATSTLKVFGAATLNF
jgi:hypothetical protein